MSPFIAGVKVLKHLHALTQTHRASGGRAGIHYTNPACTSVGNHRGVLFSNWRKQNAPKEYYMNLQPSLVDPENYYLSNRIRIIHALAKFRGKWESKISDISLVTVEVSIGMLLSDIADCLELTPQERHVLLGSKLIKEVSTFMEQHIRLKLP
jgi:hypothetical protein